MHTHTVSVPICTPSVWRELFCQNEVLDGCIGTMQEFKVLKVVLIGKMKYWDPMWHEGHKGPNFMP